MPHRLSEKQTFEKASAAHAGSPAWPQGVHVSGTHGHVTPMQRWGGGGWTGLRADDVEDVGEDGAAHAAKHAAKHGARSESQRSWGARSVLNMGSLLPVISVFPDANRFDCPDCDVKRCARSPEQARCQTCDGFRAQRRRRREQQRGSSGGPGAANAAWQPQRFAQQGATLLREVLRGPQAAPAILRVPPREEWDGPNCRDPQPLLSARGGQPNALRRSRASLRHRRDHGFTKDRVPPENERSRLPQGLFSVGTTRAIAYRTGARLRLR